QLDDLRRIGATARTMLIAAAARRWRVAAAGCDAEGGKVVHASSGRAFTFGELADEAGAMPVPKQEAVTLRPWASLKRVGRPLPLLDGPAFVTGTAVFGADVVLPGMMTAVVARPPVPGGKV